jgi:hypothetical protein
MLEFTTVIEFAAVGGFIVDDDDVAFEFLASTNLFFNLPKQPNMGRNCCFKCLRKSRTNRPRQISSVQKPSK